MRRLVFAVGVLALGFAASTPARADFSLVKSSPHFAGSGGMTALNPMGTRWSRIATAPDLMGAWAAQDAAVKKGKCK